VKAKIIRPELGPGRRILAVSDIHGNLEYFRGLLQAVDFCREDILVLVGDMMEKGPESLRLLRFIMRLQRDHTIFPLSGNCDGWHDIFTHGDDDMAVHVRAYMAAHPEALLSQMCAEIGFPVSETMDTAAMRRELWAHFQPEFAFLAGLPTILDSPRYLFVHGGLPEGRLEELDAFACMKNDNFMNQGRKFDKWCIVGHWPVMLYGENITCANPIIDRESRIISIDGGCVLKDDGQLNALVIPYDGSEDFSFVAYDAFPRRRVRTAQRAGERSYYIRWGDNQVRVLERGAEFSRCEHVRTGYRMDILTRYLYGEGALCRCNDCTDYMLPLEAGDTVSVVEETSRGYLVKHRGVSGWYYGELD